MLSIIIPTWNNLPYLKLCVESIRKHTHVPYEIILHINDGSDGTLSWAKENNISFTHTPENKGICYAVNLAAAKATQELIVYMNDDMYCCPGWDTVIADEVRAIPHDFFMLSGTLIEPEASGNACVRVADFGRDVNSFRENELLSALPSLQKPDWNGASWPPCIMSHRLWDLVGGFSIEFSPGMASDDDLSRKLWAVGCRYFKGLGKCLVYHFQAKSTGRIKKNDGRKTFLLKWGMNMSVFNKHYLRRGTAFNGPLEEPAAGIQRADQFKVWLKKKFKY
jgi:glycosyltransferase involved in cell wall biosynthesis